MTEPPLALPDVFVAADRASLEAQRRFLRSTRAQLLLLVVAGTASVFTIRSGRLDVAALVGGLALVAAAVLRLRLLRTRPHRIWYEGRAVAESVKTLAWRYAVGGEPFPRVASDADTRFARHVREVTARVPAELGLADQSVEPTVSMEALRSSGRAERIDAYQGGRVRDQIAWYRAKAAWNRRRSTMWGVAILVLQLGAALGAFLKGFGVIDVDLFGLAAAVVASAAAWLEARQHGTLAAAYRITAEELEAIDVLILEQRTEEEWAKFVGDSEAAFSREHTMWKASSSQRKPAALA